VRDELEGPPADPAVGVHLGAGGRPDPSWSIGLEVGAASHRGGGAGAGGSAWLRGPGRTPAGSRRRWPPPRGTPRGRPHPDAPTFTHTDASGVRRSGHPFRSSANNRKGRPAEGVRSPACVQFLGRGGKPQDVHPARFVSDGEGAGSNPGGGCSLRTNARSRIDHRSGVSNAPSQRPSGWLSRGMSWAKRMGLLMRVMGARGPLPAGVTTPPPI